MSEEITWISLDRAVDSAHTGLFVACDNNIFQFPVDFIIPQSPLQSISDVCEKRADFGLTSAEALMAHAARQAKLSAEQRRPCIALATCLQRPTTAIFAWKSPPSKNNEEPEELELRSPSPSSTPPTPDKSALFDDLVVDRPSLLKGLRVGCVDDLEAEMVKHAMWMDGGGGEFIRVNVSPTSCWEAFKEGEIDAVVGRTSWEGIECQLTNLDVSVFRLFDFGAPLAYSPVLFCLAEKLEKEPQFIHVFMKAVNQGYNEAAQDPALAITCLQKRLPAADPNFLAAAQEHASPLYIDPSFGVMEDASWERAYDWACRQDIVGACLHDPTVAKTDVDVSKLFVNFVVNQPPF